MWSCRIEMAIDREVKVISYENKSKRKSSVEKNKKEKT